MLKRLLNESGMFSGEYTRKLDTQNRIRLPKAFIREGIASLIVNRNPNGALVLHTRDVWKIITEIVNNLDMKNKSNREFSRCFYQGATELFIDSQGRILVPSSLLKYLNAERDLLLVGLSNRIEVWNSVNFTPGREKITKLNEILYAPERFHTGTLE